MVKLTDKKIEWAVTQVINKGESTERVAAIYGLSRRRIQQLVKYYRETGEDSTVFHWCMLIGLTTMGPWR